MALHGGQDGDDVSCQDGWSVLVLSPPFIEGVVGAVEEALFWWWCFRKGIGNISSIDQQVLHGGNCIEHASI